MNRAPEQLDAAQRPAPAPRAPVLHGRDASQMSAADRVCEIGSILAVAWRRLELKRQIEVAAFAAAEHSCDDVVDATEKEIEVA